MGHVRGSQDSLGRWKELDLRFSGSVWITYATVVALVEVLLHLNGRHNLHNTYEQICLRAHGNGKGLARVRAGWESGKARAAVAKLWGACS